MRKRISSGLRNTVKNEEDIANNVFSVMVIPGDIGSEVDRIEYIPRDGGKS